MSDPATVKRVVLGDLVRSFQPYVLLILYNDCVLWEITHNCWCSREYCFCASWTSLFSGLAGSFYYIFDTIISESYTSCGFTDGILCQFTKFLPCFLFWFWSSFLSKPHWKKADLTLALLVCYFSRRRCKEHDRRCPSDKALIRSVLRDKGHYSIIHSHL